MEADELSRPFDSGSALREGNRAVLERLHTYGGDDFPDSFLDEIELFQQRAAATGAFLSAVDDRGEAQSLINFWLTILVNGGRRPATMILHAFDSEAARARAGGAPPYKGLDAFQIEDSASFFGRRSTVRAMLDRLDGTRLLAVTGLSGSGKSSVVRAGLIPRLREGELPGSRDWLILDPIVPGKDPVGALSGLPPAEPGFSRLADPEELVARLDATGGAVLLSVDQFEELFTLGASEADRCLVLGSLAAAATGGRYRHIVVITMRSEYDSRVEIHAAFAELFAAGRIQIGAMSARELRAAIEQPATQVGVSFEPGLAEELVQRALGEPAGLPLLQFTLLELWKRRSGENALSWEAYAALGGSPREILARRASEVYESFKTAQDRTFSHRIFLALAEIGAGLEPTARRVTRAELDRVGSRDNVDHVLSVWQENGLIRISPPGPISAASLVEVAHEALIRNWDRLVRWIEDHFAESRRRRVLTEQALAWKEGGQDTLLGELSLKEAESLDDLDHTERAYVAASRAEVDRANRRIRRQKLSALAAVAGALLLLLAASWQFARAQYESQRAQDETARANRESQHRLLQQRRFGLAMQLQTQQARTLVAYARRQEADARSSYDRVRALLAGALRARDAMLVQQRNIRTQTATATGSLQALEGQIADYEQRLEAQAAALVLAADATAAAEATIARAAMTTAQERPALLVSHLSPSQVPGVWRQLTEPATRARIQQGALSVGLLRTGTGPSSSLSTAFMISDRVAAALLPDGEHPPVAGWTLDFGDAPESDPSRLFRATRKVEEIGLVETGATLVLFELAGANPAGNPLPPPLRLAEVGSVGRGGWISRRYGPNVEVPLFAPEPGTQLYLIGFPMPPEDDELGRYVLGGTRGKRVQPGFVLGVGGGEVSTRMLQHDATAFPGNTGSPVFDLATGTVVGIHWVAPPPRPGEPDPGKFAVAFDAWLLGQEAIRPFLPLRASVRDARGE